MTEGGPIIRADGVTPAERYLKRLCDRTFLSLWSYPGIYRDQGGGKEVADLLVVFGDHIIIFSDKDCALPDTGNTPLDWSRWFRKAIVKNAEQIFGAERWIRDHPDRLFLDRACTQPFPLKLPDPSVTKVHRVVVAHGVAERCQREHGGKGSLKIIPDIVGAKHTAPLADGGQLFAIGLIDATAGYVHVLDEGSLDFVMAELDTVSDFVAYLEAKEALISEGRLAYAASEADLLAHYLYPVEGKDESSFILPDGVDRLTIGAGLWDAFDRDPHRVARQEANAVSYFWDSLIEESAGHVIANTQYFATQPGIRSGAEALRIPARETRTLRRLLAGGILEVVNSTPSLPNFRRVRIMEPTEPGRPYYVFLFLSPTLHGMSQNECREFRRNFLAGYCDVVKLKYPDAEDIVGIATELGDEAGRSQDVIYRDARVFTEEDRINAQRFADDYKILTNVVRSVHTEYDYPDPANLSA